MADGGSFNYNTGQGNDYWSQFPTHGPGAPSYTPAPNAGVSTPSFGSGPDTGQSQQGPSDGQAGGDYQSEFLAAAQALGISPQQFRSNPQAMDAVTNYLTQKYPGQNWTNGGERAGDWVSVNGQGFDVLPAGDANWQWLSDPANSQAGAGGGTLGGIAGGGAPLGFADAAAAGDYVRGLPGYQFSVDEAQRALEHGAAARGNLLTGGFQKELGKYIANAVAGPAYQSALGNFGNLASLGENAAAMSGTLGTNFSNAAGNTLTGIGNANAAGSIASGNAWSNAVNQLGQIGASSYLNSRNPYLANSAGYNPTGVNGYGVTTIPVQEG
jgi:hypothetical protein